MNGIIFWIPGNTPSSKNSQVWTGSFLVMSAAARKWIKLTKYDWEKQKGLFISVIRNLPTPYYIEFTYIRGSRRTFDYINATQIVCDQMTKHGWINDDNADIIKPYFGDYQYDKVNPGVEIRVLAKKPKHYDI